MGKRVNEVRECCSGDVSCASSWNRIAQRKKGYDEKMTRHWEKTAGPQVEKRSGGSATTPPSPLPHCPTPMRRWPHMKRGAWPPHSLCSTWLASCHCTRKTHSYVQSPAETSLGHVSLSLQIWYPGNIERKIENKCYVPHGCSVQRGIHYPHVAL